MSSTSKSMWTFPLTLALAACSGTTHLEPAESAHEYGAFGEDAAIVENADLRLIADGDEWTGEPGVREHVTPVWMRIENLGDSPLRIQLSEIALKSNDGDTYSALPPVDTEGKVRIDVDAIIPRFGYKGFEVAQRYGTVYRDVKVEPSPAIMDEPYYDEMYDRWDAIVPLPTQQMLEVALPEGTVSPGGSVDGYVYFERVDEDAGEVTLDVRLSRATSGETLAQASIPFEVDR